MKKNRLFPRFDRGYTGHEHLSGFGLIHMNARVYDPYLQRFLSPDNYIQDMTNAQNYNRYSYCINNPLKYVDPSGNKWKMWDKTAKIAALSVLPIGVKESIAVTALGTAAVSGAAGLVFGGVEEGKKRAKNSLRIDAGIFKTDNDNSLLSQFWQVGSRFTPWEATQTTWGNIIAHGHNIGGNVKSVNHFYGATVLDVNRLEPNGRNIGGNYIVVKEYNGIQYEDGILTKQSKTLIHEYGHYMQNRRYGLGGYILVGINSGRNPNPYSSKNPVAEKDAYNMGYTYFAEKGISMTGALTFDNDALELARISQGSVLIFPGLSIFNYFLK